MLVLMLSVALLQPLLPLLRLIKGMLSVFIVSPVCHLKHTEDSSNVTFLPYSLGYLILGILWDLLHKNSCLLSLRKPSRHLSRRKFEPVLQLQYLPAVCLIDILMLTSLEWHLQVATSDVQGNLMHSLFNCASHCGLNVIPTKNTHSKQICQTCAKADHWFHISLLSCTEIALIANLPKKPVYISSCNHLS